MQDLVYFPLSKVKFPATAMLIYSVIIEIVTFDLFPTDDWYPAWFDLPAVKPFSPEFEVFDYWSTIFMISIGSLWMIGVLILLKYPIYYIFKDSRFWVFRWIANSLKQGLFWATPVDFMLTGYVEFVFAVLINYWNF